MQLVELFQGQQTTDDEWKTVSVTLPKDANLIFIRGELSMIATDLVTEIGYTEVPGGLELGFRSEAIRDQVLGHLQPVIERSQGMTDKKAHDDQMWKKLNRRGIFIDPEKPDYRYEYVDTVDSTRTPEDFQ